MKREAKQRCRRAAVKRGPAEYAGGDGLEDASRRGPVQPVEVHDDREQSVRDRDGQSGEEDGH